MRWLLLLGCVVPLGAFASWKLIPADARPRTPDTTEPGWSVTVSEMVPLAA